MSNNYDNWGRLVEAVLRREQDREVALADSRESSFRSISSSSRFGPDSSFHEQNPQLEAYNSDTINLLGDKMVHRRPEAPPRLLPPLRTTLRSYLRNPFSCLTAVAQETSSASTNTTIKEVLTNEGKYERHNLYGNLFEVSSKYVPPIIPIGCGAHSLVCAANNKETYERVAIKKIGNPFDNRIDAKRTLREIKLLRHMDHENIIAIKDIIRPPKKDAFNDVYIVCELMETDLHQIIQSDQPLTDEHCQFFLYQLLRGLKYVHSANVLHRDLEPRNLLLNANCDLKIGGFGLAGTTSETDFMTECVFTCWYRAPELLLNCSEYTAAIDVWSVGCILAEIMNREPLFPGKDYIQQLKLITELIGTPDDVTLEFLRCDNARKFVMLLHQFPKQQLSARFPNMPPLALDLLEKLLVFDPNQRINVDDALCHPYLSSLHDINDEPICSKPFSFDFEQQAITEESIKDLIWMESIAFNPDPAH